MITLLCFFFFKQKTAYEIRPCDWSSDVCSSDLETWQTSNSVRREDGHTLAFFNPYFQVSLPSRFYDPALVGVVGRPIDVCYEVTPAGNAARGGACGRSTSNGTITGITFDDPRSVFDGTDRAVDINSNFIDNAAGPQVWYTDPFGKHGRTTEFP